MQGPSGRPVCTARGDAVLPLQARPPRSQRVSKLRWSQSLCFTASPAGGSPGLISLGRDGAGLSRKPIGPYEASGFSSEKPRMLESLEQRSNAT